MCIELCGRLSLDCANSSGPKTQGLKDAAVDSPGRWLRGMSRLLLASTALTGTVVAGSTTPSDALFGWGESDNDDDDVDAETSATASTGLGRQDGPSTSGRVDEIGTTVSSTESSGFGNGFGNNSDRENEEREAASKAQKATTAVVVVDVPAPDPHDAIESPSNDDALAEATTTDVTFSQADAADAADVAEAADVADAETTQVQIDDVVDAEFAASVYGDGGPTRPGKATSGADTGARSSSDRADVVAEETDSRNDDVSSLSDSGVATTVQQDGSILESWYDPEADTVVDRWSDGVEAVETVFDSDGRVISRTSENSLDGSSLSARFENGEPVSITASNSHLGLESTVPISPDDDNGVEASIDDSLVAFGGVGAPVVSSDDVVVSGAELQAKKFSDHQDEKFDEFLVSLPEDLPTEHYLDQVDEYVKTVEQVERETFTNTNDRVDAAFSSMADAGVLTGDREADLQYWHDQERYELAAKAMEQDYLSGEALSDKWTELKQRQAAESEQVADAAAIDGQLADIKAGRKASAANGEFVDLNGLVHDSQAGADASDQVVARDQGFASVADARAAKDIAWAQVAVNDPPLQNADEILENTPGIDTAVGLAEFGIGVGTLDPALAIGGLVGALPGPNYAKLMPNSMTRPRTEIVDGPNVAANDATVDGGGSIVKDGSTSMWPTVAVGAGAAVLLTSDTENLATETTGPEIPDAAPDGVVDVVPVIGDLPVLGDAETPATVTPGQPDTGDFEVLPNPEPDGPQPFMTPLSPGTPNPAWVPAAPNDEHPEDAEAPRPVVVPGDDDDLAIPLPWPITPDAKQPDSVPTITMSTDDDDAGAPTDADTPSDEGAGLDEDRDVENSTDPAVADAMDRARGFNQSALAEFENSQQLLVSSGRSDQTRDGSPLEESTGEGVGEMGAELAKRAAIAERNAGLRALTALVIQRQAGIENVPSGDDDEVALLRDRAMEASDQAGKLRTEADVLQVRIDADETDLEIPDGGVEGLRSQVLEAERNARRIALEALVIEAGQQPSGPSSGNASTVDAESNEVSRDDLSSGNAETKDTTAIEAAQVEADGLNNEALIEHDEAQRLSRTRDRINTVADGESGARSDSSGRALVNADLDRDVELAERSAGARALQALTIQRGAGIDNTPSDDDGEIESLRRQALNGHDLAAELRASMGVDQGQIDAGETNNVRMFNEPRERREVLDRADELEAQARRAALQALVAETNQRRSSGVNSAVGSDKIGDVSVAPNPAPTVTHSGGEDEPGPIENNPESSGNGTDSNAADSESALPRDRVLYREVVKLGDSLERAKEELEALNSAAVRTFRPDIKRIGEVQGEIEELTTKLEKVREERRALKQDAYGGEPTSTSTAASAKETREAAIAEEERRAARYDEYLSSMTLEEVEAHVSEQRKVARDLVESAATQSTLAANKAAEAQRKLADAEGDLKFAWTELYAEFPPANFPRSGSPRDWTSADWSTPREEELVTAVKEAADAEAAAGTAAAEAEQAVVRSEQRMGRSAELKDELATEITQARTHLIRTRRLEVEGAADAEREQRKVRFRETSLLPAEQPERAIAQTRSYQTFLNWQVDQKSKQVEEATQAVQVATDSFERAKASLKTKNDALAVTRRRLSQMTNSEVTTANRQELGKAKTERDLAKTVLQQAGELLKVSTEELPRYEHARELAQDRLDRSLIRLRDLESELAAKGANN